MVKAITKYLASIGQKGGKAGKGVKRLGSKRAKEIAKLRWKKKREEEKGAK